MEIEEAKEKAKDAMEKGKDVFKDAFSKAGDKIQEWGDKSVQKIEIMQLKSKRKDLIEKLGSYAEKRFYQEKAESILNSEEEVSKILEAISQIDKDIQERKNK